MYCKIYKEETDYFSQNKTDGVQICIFISKQGSFFNDF